VPEPRDIVYFPSPAAFRAWLRRHATTATEVWVGYHRKHTGQPSLTWPQSVDEALCVGWIDGVRKTVDADRYTIRFTPRKTGSHWSRVNIARMAALEAEGRVRPAGRAAFAARRDERSARATYERTEPAVLDTTLEKRFRTQRAAWDFFMAQPPGYRRTAIHWIVSAKREETRVRRLDQLIADSAAHRRLGLLSRPDGSSGTRT
jgi:uncharacterized protein YdeI (YjbR/CyaY-like superfamily)